MCDHYIDIGYQKIARILHDDIANQDKLGFCGMQSYQPQRCAMPTAMGLQTFGATLWNHKTDFDALCADYFYHAYGECWQDVYSYLDGLSSRYDFIIKPGGRNILALDCVPVMEDCLAAVRDFCAKYDNTTSDNSARNRSWKDLCLYNKYLRELLSAFLLGLRGNEAEGKSKIDALVDWLWSIEDEVQERWDIYVLTVHLPVWYNRLMKVKRDEEQGIFTHSYSWFPSGDQ
jgi:hypothetical protein